MWGSGSPFREFLHVNELADACLFLMQNYNAIKIGEFVNIGRGEDIQIKELAKLIKAMVDYKGSINWDSTKPNGTPKKFLNVEKINKLGLYAKFDLSSGIRSVYEKY